MMKIKHILSGVLFLIAISMGYSQTTPKGARIVTAAQTIQTNNTGSNNYTIQTGLPILGQNRNVTTPPATQDLQIRFPWGVLYLFDTFSEDSFEVSKGFFGDKILVNWQIGANANLITTLKLYRREYTEDGSQPYQFVANIAPTATSYEDRYVDGGILYEYKLFAQGIVQGEVRLSNFITGIGFRNPTAIVTGNVTFEGGNPVKDVTLRARSSGSDFNYGSGLMIPDNGQLLIDDLNKPVVTKMTFQTWVKPVDAFSNNNELPIRLFLTDSDPQSIYANVKLNATANELIIDVKGQEFTLKNYMPSGAVNTRGDDILVPVSNFNTSFTHITIQVENGIIPKVFINGRPVTDAYVSTADDALRGKDANYTEPFFALSLNEGVTPINLDTDELKIGGLRAAYIDEIRVYNTIKSPKVIRSDYSRYISGNDAGMIAYLRANEGVGDFAYDLSRNGFNYNKNNGKLATNSLDKVLWESNVENFPNENQLGILGITDENGNYEINAIPYTGTGESFTITPLFGQHEFDPGQQLVFLGQGSEVVNKIDFKDISAFNFNGQILYDTRGVFKSFVELNENTTNNLTDGDEYVSGPGIIDEGYNTYEKSGIKYPKGEYWYNENEDRLERYARIGLKGANVFVDGDIVLDENNFPVETDAEGKFSIDVPIGNHFITVKKNGHEFVASGRFPAATPSFQEFFEDAVEPVFFIDETRVAIVGKVVGGSVEAAKPIGFGENGIATRTFTNSEGIEETVRYSAKNNIGQAKLVFGHKPAVGSIVPETRFTFETNAATGEYRVEVMPLQYEISETNGITISSNVEVNIGSQILESNEILNFEDVNEVSIPEFVFSDDTVITGVPFNYEQSLVYRSIPTMKVVKQTFDPVVLKSDKETASTSSFEVPVITQGKTYEVVLNTFERYENKDDGSNTIEDIVPVVDGNLNITNNLALNPFNYNTQVTRSTTEPSLLTYKFKAGLPTISTPFTKSISIIYEINGNSYEAEDLIKDVIVLGGKSDGSQTFVTAGPDMPDIILRDPPGTNSSARIKAGQTVSFTTERNATNEGVISTEFTIKAGLTVGAGGGLAGPVVEQETTNNINTGISVTTGSTDGSSLNKTYTFSQEIATSDDPEFVGAEGDLYIGQSKNFSYGSFDNVQISDVITGDPGTRILVADDGTEFEISKQKAMFFADEPTETMFVYSQKFILEELIPSLELIVSNIEGGLLDPSDPDANVLTIEEYNEQIRLWKNVILENERSKYLAFKEREAYKQQTIDQIDAFRQDLIDEIDGSIGIGSGGDYVDRLKDQLGAMDILRNQVLNNFDDNISFDAGVGEITRSVETSIVNTTVTAFNVKIDEKLSFDVGFGFNGAGFINSTGGSASQDITSSLTEEQQETTEISFTLKDNDPANFLSVDVINAFDGNGPIFSTIGGRTSCPYEGAELSYFYDKETYQTNPSSIERISEESEREQLSAATQKAEDPRISVEIAEINNIPESDAAEFKLILENNADTNGNGEGFGSFELRVDNTTNPFNAEFNIGSTNTFVDVPYGEKVEYFLTLRKSISDVYDYKDIRIILQSVCDSEEVFDDILISASFIPSCSKVVVNAPLNNFSFNRDSAFNLDGTTNSLNVELGEFNSSFNSFEKIELEYRKATSPSWTRLQTYYNTQDFLDAAIDNNETKVSLIESANINYAFDIAGLNLADGEYEIRARSSCTNGTEYISEPIIGRVDLTSPQKFGTPFPLNGIYATGTDLRARFSEDIFYNSAVSLLEIKGQTNQLPVTNEVSLFFNGLNNTMVIENPRIANGDLSIEFWMNNQTTASSASIISQPGGIDVSLEGTEMVFKLAGAEARGIIAVDDLFHHYTLTYNSETGDLKIIEEDRVLKSVSANVDASLQNNNNITIGGNTFIGNMSQLRFWNIPLSLDDSFAMMYSKLMGNEAGLTAYYPLDEGRGNIAKDKARFKDAIVTTDWDIKPKGESYSFSNGASLTLDNVGFAQLTPTMDATISFWMKTDVSQDATIFSNGKGDGTDPVMSGGFSNKWSIDLASNGNLSFNSEGINLPLTEQSVVDDKWHHVSIRLNRLGSMRTYVDQNLVSTNSMTGIGGFSGNRAYLGVRGSADAANMVSLDRPYQGSLDEFRLWNTLRTNDQEDRDAYEEIDPETIGLMIYSRFNAPDPLTGNGPQYFHAFSNNTVIPSNAVMQSGTTAYNQDSPAIKPARELIKIPVNYVINGDEIILEPQVNSFAEIEGQILDVTIHRLFDSADNRQQSPVTWSVFVQKNDMDWYAEGFNNDVIDITKDFEQEEQFELTIVNRGGANQPFRISNIPSWLNLSASSGTVSPASQITITATIDALLDPGVYTQDLRLSSDFGLDQVQLLNVRVLGDTPNWTVDPTQFEHSMNVIGILKIDGQISEDEYDKIAAFSNGEVRGVTILEYNPNYEQSFAFLTLYSNQASGENITFKVWDASTGNIIQLELDDNSNLTFLTNEVIGSLNQPAVFSNTNVTEKEYQLNAGWNWLSLNIEDPRASDLNQLTSNMNLETSDLIMSSTPARLDTYFKRQDGSGSWSGSISASGGLKTDFMYKIYMHTPQTLKLSGSKVDMTTYEFEIKQNWNWLSFPLLQNVQLSRALSNFNPTEGDVIKSQNLFAIYDQRNGWSGTLKFLEQGKGYMINSSTGQQFSYPASVLKSLGTFQKEEFGENKPMDKRFYQYPENMNAIVKLPSSYNKLYVYDDVGVLKGHGENQMVGDHQLTFITIYGEKAENLNYYVGYDESDLTKATNLLEFNSNKVLGKINDPVVLKLGSDSTTALDAFVLYPNPFDERLVIKMISEVSQSTSIQLFSIDGRLVFEKQVTLKTGGNSVQINPNISSGTYFLKVSNSTTTEIKKVIKK